MTGRTLLGPATAALVIVAITACSGTSSPPAGKGSKVAARPAASPAARQPDTASQAGPLAGDSVVNCGGASQTVSTADQLTTALAGAKPGTKIALAPGVYEGDFTATASGTSSAPITLCGDRTAILSGLSVSSGYTFYLDHASWWRLAGFTVAGGQKGVVADGSSDDVIDGLSVHGTGDEAIHLRSFSSHDVVSNNLIRDTGLDVPFYGEGIYVGSAHKNWCRYTACSPDASDDNTIIDNNIANTTAENIDIKEGTSGGSITGNVLSGAGMVSSAATAWVNVKGNGWKIAGNSGVNSIGDGYQVHQVYPGWGLQNTFIGNKAVLSAAGVGIYVQSSGLQTVVGCDNSVTGGQLSNLPCQNI